MSQLKNPTPTAPFCDDDYASFFDGLISHFSVDKMMMQTDTAPEDTKQFYMAAMDPEGDDLHNYGRIASTRHFIGKIVSYYINQLSTYKKAPQKLAFDFSDAKVLVWAQIADNDEATEDALILSEAETNAKYADFGFYVSSTIVEESDKLSIPQHYHLVK